MSENCRDRLFTIVNSTSFRATQLITIKCVHQGVLQTVVCHSSILLPCINVLYELSWRKQVLCCMPTVSSNVSSTFVDGLISMVASSHIELPNKTHFERTHPIHSVQSIGNSPTNPRLISSYVGLYKFCYAFCSRNSVWRQSSDWIMLHCWCAVLDSANHFICLLIMTWAANTYVQKKTFE